MKNCSARNESVEDVVRIMAAYKSEKSSCDKVFSELEDALLEIQDRIADITADMKGEVA